MQIGVTKGMNSLYAPIQQGQQVAQMARGVPSMAPPAVPQAQGFDPASLTGIASQLRPGSQQMSLGQQPPDPQMVSTMQRMRQQQMMSGRPAA